jgi:hypothetical protein
MTDNSLKVYKLKVGILLFGCGETSNRFNRKKNADGKRPRTCTNCGAFAIAKIFKCKTCKKTFQKGLRGKGTEFCSDVCRPWMSYAYDKPLGTEPSRELDAVSSVSAPPRNTNCKDYLKRCLCNPHGRLMKDPRACIGCLDYEPETEGSVLDHIKVFGSISQIGIPSNVQCL